MGANSVERNVRGGKNWVERKVGGRLVERGAAARKSSVFDPGSSQEKLGL